MSFGLINDIIDDIKILLENHNDKNYNLNNLEKMKRNIHDKLVLKYINYNSKILDEIFNRIIKKEYKINCNISFDNGYNCFRELEDIYNDIEVPLEFTKIEKIFNKLKKLPQPVQRTKEWFDYRYNRITASDTAAAIDSNPYEPVESFILKKCDPNFPFRDNVNVHHGKKYESIATMIYEHIYNNRVFEFGALPSEKYNFLGASPDGICSKYSLDNKFSEKFGTMLEIKCPITRNIIKKGKIIGEICPYYYYCQIQQQLECCELDICDFWQCKITEYQSRNDYLLDTNEKCIITDNLNELNIDSKLKKGIILEFYPKVFNKEFDEDNIEWKSQYIYPKCLDLSDSDYDEWIINILNNYKDLYPNLNNYYFNRLIYWKLDIGHNEAIKKDNNFIEKIIPILEDTWKKVIYYRKNKDKLDELKEIIDKKKKYIKINTNYKISNESVIKDKLLFLNSSFTNN